MTNLEILLETDRGTLGVLTGYYWPTHVVVLWARSALILPLKIIKLTSVFLAMLSFMQNVTRFQMRYQLCTQLTRSIHAAHFE